MNSTPSSDTIRRQPRSIVAIASSERISYRGIVFRNIGPPGVGSPPLSLDAHRGRLYDPVS
jgi:hypothetical protein